MCRKREHGDEDNAEWIVWTTGLPDVAHSIAFCTVVDLVLHGTALSLSQGVSNLRVSAPESKAEFSWTGPLVFDRSWLQRLMRRGLLIR